MDERENLRYPLFHSGHEIWPKKQWLWSRDRAEKAQLENKLVFNYNEKNSNWSVRFKGYLLAQDGEEKAGKPTSVLIGPYTQEGTKDFEFYFDREVFPFPKPVELITKLLSITVDGVDIEGDDICVDFFGGSGTTAEAVMRLNAEDGGKRQFILVQIPQAIDPKKQKEAHSFVTDTLGKSEATIFEITAERIRRAGAKLQSEQIADLATEPVHLDTGFRVFELADDPDALILQKPLAEATQADLVKLQTTIATPQPEQLTRILYNLLLAEGLPLSTRIDAVQADLHPQALYRAGDVLIILQEVDTEDLRQALAQLKTAGTPVQHLSVYAPWVQDNNFLLGLKTLLETLGLSEDKLRLRG
jgi:adenine-specific DNA-methyltransferase